MDKYTNERVKKMLREYIKRMNRRFKLQKVILFGSRARGDYLLTSDVDVILVSEDFGGLKFRDRMAEALSEWDAYVDIEPLCYTPEEFERKSRQIGIVSQAIKEGVVMVPS